MTNSKLPGNGVNLTDVLAALQRVENIKASRKELHGKVEKIEASRTSVSETVYKKVKADYQTKLAELENDYGLLKKDLLPAFMSLQKEFAETSSALSACDAEIEEVDLRFNLGEFSQEEHRVKQEEATSRKSSIGERNTQIEEALNRIYELLGNEPEFLTISSPLPAAQPEEAVETAEIKTPISPDAVKKAAEATQEKAVPAAPEPQGTAERDELLEAAFGGSGIPDLEEEILEAKDILAAEPQAEDDRSLRVGDSSVPSEFFEDVIDVSDTAAGAQEKPGLREGVPDRPVVPTRSIPAEIQTIPTLIIKDKEDREQSYQLQTGPTMIGRAPENDIVLLEENISRRHAKMIREAGRIFIQDLNSSNGTWVNGKKLAPHQPCDLQDNDVIKIGKTLVLFKCAPDD